MKIFATTDLTSFSIYEDKEYCIFVNACETTQAPKKQKLKKLSVDDVVVVDGGNKNYKILPYPIIRGSSDTEYAALTDAFAFVDNQMQPALKEHSSGLLVNNAPAEYYPKIIIQNWDYI